MELSRLAFKAAVYLANRMSKKEMPCAHCQGQGVVMPECIYDRHAPDCPFCFGTGVDPSTYRHLDGQSEGKGQSPEV
jgi:hypothetical protein